MVFYFKGLDMNIFVYSDESGVFDKAHNDVFVFAGIIVLGKENKEIWSRKYSAAETVIRKKNSIPAGKEIKATTISNGDKGKLFRSLNQCYKFSVVINQKEVLDEIFDSKKDKQRYLDFAYKIAVKRALEDMLLKDIIKSEEVHGIYFFVDEHTTATNGKYELREGLEQEMKIGTYNWKYSKYFPPIFPSVNHVELEFCNSATKLLVRAADIVANKVYHLAITGKTEKIKEISNMHVVNLP